MQRLIMFLREFWKLIAVFDVAHLLALLIWIFIEYCIQFCMRSRTTYCDLYLVARVVQVLQTIIIIIINGFVAATRILFNAHRCMRLKGHEKIIDFFS